MKAGKNIFGQYLPYVSPTLSDADKVIIESVLNNVADGIQAQIDMEEFIKQTADVGTMVHFLVGQVNKYTPEGTTKADGKNLRVLAVKVRDERIAGYYVNISTDITGIGTLYGAGKVLKNTDIDITVDGNVVSCSEPIIDGKIIFTNIQEDKNIVIVFS